MSAFDKERNRVNDTETVLDQDQRDDYGHENDNDRDYGERPQRGSKPKTINLSDLARGGTGADNNANLSSMRLPSTKNLTNRVPGIAELLEADSEVVRDLARKPTTQFNPQFLQQQRAQRDARDARLDEKQDYLYDRAERERRHEEREKLREERHRREMQQRSRFHKQAAKAGEEVKTTLEEHNESMVARTNQLGTMIEQLRADVLEAQVEQQALQRKLFKQSCEFETNFKRQLSWASAAVYVVLALTTLTLFVLVVWPAIRRRWFNDGNKAGGDAVHAVQTAAEEPKVGGDAKGAVRPTALESSEDLSIGI